MGKGRNKKKAKQNIASKPLQTANINLPENMSAEAIQHIIACAIVEAEEIKTQKAEEQRKATLIEWRDKIGYREYKNKFKQFFNEVKVFIKVLFLPKKHIEGNRASEILLKLFIALFFWIMKCCSLILSILLIALVPAQYIMQNITVLPWYQNMLYIFYGVLAFVFSRLFRMAGIEIDNLDDRNYLFGLFASITSFVSIIIAVIAIVKGA
ncbi:MAG: hypothetical protein K2M73_01145 [Lachnospiraceae bacterium]|nr:hypothetical protein [Lachnospiraceae bacterium]